MVEKRCTGFKRTFTSMIRYTLHYLMNMYYAHVTVKVFLNLECLGFFPHFFKSHILLSDIMYKYCNIYGFAVRSYTCSSKYVDEKYMDFA